VRELKKGFPNAVESGATDLLYIGPLVRETSAGEQAKRRLADSLCELADSAAECSLRVVFEPLDRGIRERGLVGRTADAFALIEPLRTAHPNLCLGWDTSHAALSGDELEAGLRLAYPLLAQLHLANVVIDPEHNEYGDHHGRMGPPGLLTTARIAELLRLLASLRQAHAPAPYLSFEVRTPADGDPWETEQHTREVRNEAWQLAQAL
jgi:sugar phosphate isomerase/epimerase